MDFLRRWFATRTPYLGWLLASTAALLVAQWWDPYVFGFATLGAMGVSALLVVASLLCGRRWLWWALLAATPALASLVLLSSYRWA